MAPNRSRSEPPVGAATKVVTAAPEVGSRRAAAESTSGAERIRRTGRPGRRIHGNDDLHAFLDVIAFDHGFLSIREARADTRHRELTFLIEIPQHRRELSAARARAGSAVRAARTRACAIGTGTAARKLSIAEAPGVRARGGRAAAHALRRLTT